MNTHPAVGMGAPDMTATITRPRQRAEAPPPATTAVSTGTARAPEHPSRRLRFWVRRALEVGIVAAVAVVLLRRAHQAGAVGGLLFHVQWEWLVAGAVAEALSLLALSYLQQRLLRESGTQAKLRRLVPVTLAGNAVAMSIPAGVLVAEGYVYRQYRRLRASPIGAMWTELAAGALAAAALAAVAFAGALVGESGLRTVLLPTLAVVVVGSFLAAVLFRRTAWLAALTRWLLARAEQHVPGTLVLRLRRMELQAAEMVSFRPSIGTWTIGFSAAALNWLLDAFVLAAAVLAVGARARWSDLLVIYAAAQLLRALPITPGGLGVVEGGLVAMLTRLHLPLSTATASVLAYRGLSFWLLVTVGWVAAAHLHWQTSRSNKPDRWLVSQPAGARAP